MITSAEEFKKLRESLKPEEYMRAATEEASVDTWNKVIDLFPDLTEWVAHNKRVQVEILERLHKHPDARVRLVVAAKRKAPTNILQSLMTDPAESVRMAVARNAKTPREILSQMSNDKWEEIRKVVADRLTR